MLPARLYNLLVTDSIFFQRSSWWTLSKRIYWLFYLLTVLRDPFVHVLSIFTLVNIAALSVSRCESALWSLKVQQLLYIISIIIIIIYLHTVGQSILNSRVCTCAWSLEVQEKQTQLMDTDKCAFVFIRFLSSPCEFVIIRQNWYR